MEQLLLVGAVVLMFYAVIPGLGAFGVRARWRQFRSRLLDSSLFPIADYEQFRFGGTTAEATVLGRFRFFGTLEAIQGDDLIWVRNGRVSFAADMKGVKVYILFPVADKAPGVLPDQAPQELSWSRIGSLPEGSKVYLGGNLEAEHGRAIFRNRRECPLTALIYDGPETSLLARSIWSARQRNEYWNQFTAPSLLAGTVALLLIAYIFLRSPLLRLGSLTALTLATAPIAPLLPPGIVMFFMYRRWWRKGRYYRAQRDLVRLPLRYFADPAAESSAPLPGRERYERVLTGPAELHNFGAMGAQERVVPEIRPNGVIPAAPAGGAAFERRYYVYGASVRNSTAESTVAAASVGLPADPMAEFLIYREDPSFIAATCSRRARAYELIAGVTFAVGLLLNFYEVFLVLSNVVR